MDIKDPFSSFKILAMFWLEIIVSLSWCIVLFGYSKMTKVSISKILNLNCTS
jgi:hypothetical protein